MFALTMFALNYCEKITEECPLLLKCSLLEEKNVFKGEKKRKCLRGKKTRNQNIIQHFIEENYRCLLYTAGSVRK